MGIPVVSTDLPALEPFEGVVRLVDPGQDFSEQLGAALAEDDPALRKQRRDLVRANSWATRYEKIRTLVEQAMAGKATEE